MTKEQVLEKLKFDVQLRGLSKHTQDEYYTKAKIFQNHFDKPATELGEKHIREFLHYLSTEKGLVSGSVNSYNSGLRFLYGVTLDVNLNCKQIPRHRNSRKFPDILDKEEIQSIFNACDNLRDKCILMTTYGAGLRLSEVASLKVYCKPPFKNASYVVEYLGRYTHRVAISNTRIVKVENGYVTFKWRDYKDNNKQKLMTVSAEEFIRRFLIHILPDRLMKIRHYGLLGNRNKNTKLKLCKKLTNTPIRLKPKEKLSAIELIKKLTGKDFSLCPCCGIGHLSRAAPS